MLRFDLLGTAVKVKPQGWLISVSLGTLLTVVMARLRADRSLAETLLLWPIYVLIAGAMDFGHFLGHILGGLWANAPMRRLTFTLPMPLTEYDEVNISPWQHRTRAAGGPIFNLVVAGLHLALRPLTKAGSLTHHLLTVKAGFHGVMGLLSLLPIPIIDGGSILKWTLVERGRTPAEADETVGRVNMALGLTSLTFGMAQAFLRRSTAAAMLIGSGVLFLLVGWKIGRQ